jgi:hypothetical protein
METVIKKITLQHTFNENFDKAEDIEKTFYDVKAQQISKMIRQGFDVESLRKADSQLEQRAAILVDLIKAEKIIHDVQKQPQISQEESIELFIEKIKQCPDIPTFINSMLFVLEEKGFSKEFMEEMLSQLSADKNVPLETNAAEERPENSDAAKKIYQWPKDVSGLKKTKKNLEKEIYRNIRYNAPFSCISLSVENIVAAGEIRKPSMEELTIIYPVLTAILRKSLRILDMIGSLGPLKNNHIILIMPMTDDLDTALVIERLKKELKTVRLGEASRLFKPLLAFSFITFNKDETENIDSFIEKMKSIHQHSQDVFSKSVEKFKHSSQQEAVKNLD